MVEDLRIYLLGEFKVYRNGNLVSSKDWYTRQARQLFKLLLSEHGRIISVEKLTDLLWPEYSQSAHKTLRSAVNALRAVLEPTRPAHAPSRFVPSAQAGYKLSLPVDSSCWVDVFEFERGLDEAFSVRNCPQSRLVLANALQLYNGDYLSEDEAESWALPERERLRERYFGGVNRLVEWQQEAGLYDEAILLCRRALSFDASRELLYRALMQAQANLGDTGAALQTFERCRQMLDEHLGADPSPQTLDLHAKILKGQFWVTTTQAAENSSYAEEILNPAKLSSHEPPFVGRHSELIWLHQQLARAKSGQVTAAALVGEAGVGKSFLVQLFLGRAQIEKARPMAVACQAIEQGVSFAPVISMLGAWLREAKQSELDQLPRSILAQVAPLLPSLTVRLPDLPVPPAINSEQAYSRLIAGLVDLFAALCNQQGPLLLAWDDVQWADESTLLVINRLARLEKLPLLLLVAYRPEDLSENKPLDTMLRYLGRDNRTHTLKLARFNSAEVAAYLTLQNAAPPLSAAELYQTTQGNALFLVEAVRTLLEQGDTQTDTAEQPGYPFLQSQQIRDVILARWARLPQIAVNLLEMAAVIGRPFSLDLLRPDLTHEETESLETLLTRRFLVEVKHTKDNEVRLTFSHEMVRQIIYAECSPLKLMQLHRQVAENLVLRYAPATEMHAAEIAAHYQQAGARYAGQVLRYEVQAGDYSRRTFSYQQALLHYDAALQVVERCSAAEKDKWQEWIGRAYQGRGLACEALMDWEGVKESYHHLSAWAVQLNHHDLATSSVRRVAMVRSLMGHNAEAVAMSLSFIQHLQADSSAFSLAQKAKPVNDMVLRWTSLATPPFTGNAPEVTSNQNLPDKHWPTFRAASPPSGPVWDEIVDTLGASQAALLLFEYGWSLLLQGLTCEAEKCLHAAISASEETDQAALWVLSAMLLSQVYYLYGQVAEGEAWFERCIERGLQAPEAAWALTWPRLLQAYRLLGAGQLAKADQILNTLETQLAQQNDFQMHRFSVQIGFGLAALARGELDRAAELLESALACHASLYIEAYVLAEMGLATIARYRQHYGEADQRLRKTLAFCGQRGLLHLYSRVALDIVRLNLHTGQTEGLLSLLENVTKLIANAGYSDIQATCQSLIARLRLEPATPPINYQTTVVN